MFLSLAEPKEKRTLRREQLSPEMLLDSNTEMGYLFPERIERQEQILESKLTSK